MNALTNAPKYELGKLFNELLSAKTKEEGISAKLLCAMFEKEVTFSTERLHSFFQAEKGSARIEMIDSILHEFMEDRYIAMQATAQTKVEVAIGDVADPIKRDAAIKRCTEAKLDAGKQVKTLQNITRACIVALSGLRLAGATDCIIRSNKLVFTYQNEKGASIESTPLSFNAMIDMGSNLTKDRGWRTTSSRDASRLTKVANKGPSIDEIKSATIADAANLLIQLLREKNFDHLSENEADKLRAVEALLISKHFGDEDGRVSGKELGEYYNGQVDYHNEMRRDRSAA